MLRSPGYLNHVAQGWAKHVKSTNHSLPGVPRTGMQNQHDPSPVARTRPGSSVQCSEPCRTGCAHEAASGPRSLAGRGWDPMEGHDSDDCVLPHPSPGAYKRWIAKPSALSPPCTSSPACLTLISACLPCPLLRLSAPPSLHCTSLSACCCICTRGWCATDVLLDQCGAHVSTNPGKVIKQEIMCRLLRWDCSSGAFPKAHWVALVG